MSNVVPTPVFPLFAQPFATRLERALQHLRIGRPVILMDDFDRENEADLIVAADKLTVPVMAQLIRDGSGIVCLCLPGETLDRLELPPMVDSNRSRYSTAFTVSIEAREGVTTGVSADIYIYIYTGEGAVRAQHHAAQVVVVADTAEHDLRACRGFARRDADRKSVV